MGWVHGIVEVSRNSDLVRTSAVYGCGGLILQMFGNAPP